jgi:type II secretory pathway pseudopilin PulG
MFTRFFKWLISGRIQKRIWVSIGIFILLAALVAQSLKWAGRSEWENWRAKWEAKGEKFDIASVVPPKVLDHQNFAKSQFFAPLFDHDADSPTFNEARDRFDIKTASSLRYAWRKGKHRDFVVWESAFYESDLAKLADDLKRPHCRFNIRYEDGFAAVLPHLGTMRNAATLFSLSSAQRLSKGDTTGAWQDTLNGIRLGEQLRTEPFLISQLVRIAILEINFQTYWEGQVNHQWSAEQLTAFQETFQSIDLLVGMESAIRAERNMINHWFTSVAQGGTQTQGFDELNSSLDYFPAIFFYGNQYQINRILTEIILSGIDVSNHRLNVHQFKKMEEEMLDLKSSFLPFRHAIALMMLPGLDKYALKVSQTQAALDQSAIVAALERYRLAKGSYPEKLTALRPKFIAKIPGDLFHDQGLVYRINEDNSFTLYSTGYNGTDDGGELFIRGESIDFAKGDWPWPQKVAE